MFQDIDLPEPRLIITHAGKAHRDELMSVSCLLERFGLLGIDRGDPTPEELEDPSVFVIDVGGRHEPEKRNFDHHDGAAPGHCALSLLNEHYKWGLEYESWYEFTRVWDIAGPAKALESIGIPSIHVEIFSPIENWLLSEFGRYPALPRGLLSTLQEFGKHILDSAATLPFYVNRIISDHTVYTIDDLLVVTFSHIDICVSPYFKKVMGKLQETIPYQISILPSTDRSTSEPTGGWEIYRSAFLAERLNLNLLKGRADIKFAHDAGFLAITHPMPFETALDLVKQCLNVKRR